jgi:deazaflavin-dependent oxidoreductase (nitroreductase family)
VAYFEHNNGYVVAATAGGSDNDPQWIKNLSAAGQAEIQIKEHHYEVDVRIAEGAERDQLWRDVVVERAPAFAKYEEKTSRVIPVARLTPRS